MRHLAWSGMVSVVLALGGCDEETGGEGAGEPGEPEPLPPLSRAPLTTEERIVPTTAPVTAVLDPSIPEEMDRLLADGFGEFTLGPGEPVVIRTPDGSPAPQQGPGAKMLLRFVHLADAQLADDESPARVCNLDGPLAATSSAFRPQEGHECRILNASVRTINRLHQDFPLGLVILGGDNADNAQTNEVDWVLSILSGSASVDCDSGADDDPEPGANNDPKDPFIAEGLAVPWIWVTGNHDVLYQGNLPPAALANDYLSSYAATGTRDWSQPGAPIHLGEIAPDERRRPLSGSELLAKVKADGDGHGVTDAAVASGRAFYTVDAPGAPIRFVVIDTSAPTGSADGLLHRSEIDGFLRPALDGAVIEGKIVIVASHHSSRKLTDGGGLGGQTQPDAVLPDEFRDVLGEYDNVLMHLAGHTHTHTVTRVTPAMGTAYWEVETSAIADFPHQMRLIEIWDHDNGFYGIRSVAVDYQTENDPVAADGRRRAIVDLTSGWEGDGSGTPEQRNVELYVPKP